MDAPLSGKQKRENMKFLLNELRDTASFKNDQKRKDQASQQQMRLKEEKAKGVPPKMGKPTNPEAGPNDKIPALLAPGEAVIPAKAAQKPENKPLIKAMVREGRSDRNLSVPMPKGFMCGTEKVKGYQYGSTGVWDYYTDEAINGEERNISIDPQGNYYVNDQMVYQAPPEVKQQINSDRAAIKQAGIDATKPLAATADVLVGGPTNALADAGSWIANAIGVPRAGRALGIYDEDVTSVEIPKIGSGTATPFFDKTREATNANQPKQLVGSVPKGAENAVAAKSTMQVVDNKVVPTPEPEPLTNVSQIKNEIPVADPVIPMPTKDDEGNVIPVPKSESAPIPTDKSGFSKWADTIGGAIKGTYESISDPEKLKGALSSTLETLGFNGRDASRFALLVASSKALGYDTTQAVRFAGQYTLKASDQRAQTEAAVDASREKSMIAKGYVKNNKGEWIAPVRTTGSKTMTMSSGSGAGAPITMYERTDVNGTKVLVDSEGRTQDQLEKLYKAPLVTYGESTSKSGIASRWSSWEKDSTDNVKGIYNRDIKPAKKGEVSAVRQMLPADTTVANQVGLKLQELGYDIDDAKVRRQASDILTKATEQMIADAKAGNQLKTVDQYVERNVLMYKTGISQDLFKFNKNKNETAANMITGQYNQVKNQIMQENPKLNAQKLEDESQKRYQQFRDEWLGNKTESTKDLTTKQREAAAEALRKKYLESGEASGFYNYVKSRLGS